MTNQDTGAVPPLNRHDAAAYAGVSDRTISRWMHDGWLVFTRDHLTGRPQFHPVDIEDAMQTAAQARAVTVLERVAAARAREAGDAAWAAGREQQDSNKTGKTGGPQTPRV